MDLLSSKMYLQYGVQTTQLYCLATHPIYSLFIIIIIKCFSVQQNK